MTRPPCNPATLGDVCAGSCGRRLHPADNRTSRAKCDNGHPVREAHDRCPACAAEHRRNTTTVHPYCPHDEGEPCDCHVELGAKRAAW